MDWLSQRAVAVCLFLKTDKLCMTFVCAGLCGCARSPPVAEAGSAALALLLRSAGWGLGGPRGWRVSVGSEQAWVAVGLPL